MPEDIQINWSKVQNIFESVTERMGQNPDRPAIGAPKAKVRVIKEGLFEATAEGHTFQIAEPVERGGTNFGPSPTETMLGALAGCTNIIAHKCAAKNGVTFQDFSVEIKSSFDRRGVTLQDEIDVPFENIDVIIDVTTDADDASMDLVKSDLPKYCPVSKVLQQAGSNVTDVWNITKA